MMIFKAISGLLLLVAFSNAHPIFELDIGNETDIYDSNGVHYKMGDKLGEGVHAKVFKGYRVSDKAPTAIKILKGHSKSVRRTTDCDNPPELAIHRTLTKVNSTIQLYGWKTADTYIFDGRETIICCLAIFMEWNPRAMPLFRYLTQENPVNEAQLHSFFEQYFWTLDQYIQLGVGNEDMHFGNVLVYPSDFQDQLKLVFIDFTYAGQWANKDSVWRHSVSILRQILAWLVQSAYTRCPSNDGASGLQILEACVTTEFKLFVESIEEKNGWRQIALNPLRTAQWIKSSAESGDELLADTSERLEESWEDFLQQGRDLVVKENIRQKLYVDLQ